MIKKIFFLNFIFCSFAYFVSQTVGSDTTVNTPIANTLFTGGNNKISSYALMANGFSFQDSSTTCSWYSVFPLSGTVLLRGGTLHLNRNLNFSDSASISTPGRIYGDTNNIFISKNLEKFPSLFALTYQTSIDTGIDLNSIIWSLTDDGYIAVGGQGVASAGSSAQIYYWNGSSLVYRTQFINSWDSVISSMQWRPYGSFFATNLQLDLSGNLYNYVIVFQYNSGTNSLTYPGVYNSGTNINEILVVSWHPDGNALALATDNASNRLGIFEVTSSGAFGSVILATPNSNVSTAVNVCNNCLSWASYGDFLAVGFDNTGDEKQELVIYNFDEQSPFTSSTLTYTTGLNLGFGTSCLEWSKTSSYVAVGKGSSPYQLRLYHYDIDNNILSEVVEARVDVENEINDLNWNSDDSYLCLGTQTGGEREFKILKFDMDAERFYALEGVDPDWDVNGVAFAPYDQFVTFVGDNQSIEVYSYDTEYGEFVFKDSNIILKGDFEFNLPVIFSGVCKINGNGNSLNLGNEGQITVDSNSTIYFENVSLKNVASGLSCVDNSAKIVFRKVTINLLGDWAFENGSILFSSDVFIQGSKKFIYQSSKTSTIDSNSVLYFSNNSSFDYNPSVLNKNLLNFKDNSSYLYFDNASLFVTTTGLALTKGTLLLDNNVTFSILGNSLSEGLFLGDGNFENDINVNFLASCNLNIYGSVSYENVE